MPVWDIIDINEAKGAHSLGVFTQLYFEVTNV